MWGRGDVLLSRRLAAAGAAWRGWIALALAYALVGQLVLASSALALTASPAREGDFRTLFCHLSGGAGRPDAPSGGSLPLCCLLGCGLLNALAPTPPVGGLLAPLRLFVLAERQPPEARFPALQWRRTAHLARAPPAPAA